MELSYSELKKREVINVSDGKSFGQIIDLTLSFPSGNLVGITVPGRKSGWLASLFDKSKLYIPKSSLIKIGGDVILVNVNCGDTCVESTFANKPKSPPPQCPPPCSPQCPSSCSDGEYNHRIDLSDY